MDIDLQVRMKCLRIEPTIYWFSDEVSRYLNYAEQYQTNENDKVGQENIPRFAYIAMVYQNPKS